jgi:DNA modification methylase
MFKFEDLRTVNNPKSVHGIYPYRGKISSIDAERIISQLPKTGRLLDPFCGSGTILYEGAKAGLEVVGLDMNPIAVTLAEGKLSIPNKLKSALDEAEALISIAKRDRKLHNLPVEAQKYFHFNSANQIASLSSTYSTMTPYLKACFLGAVCLTARGCNQYMWTSSSVGKDINPKRDINFYDNFLNKIRKHHYPLSNMSGQVFYNDARNLSQVLAPETVSYVFTSPPYFDCLDYTAYYAKIIFEIFGVEKTLIKKSLIQNFASYSTDMKKVLDQLYLVCKTGAIVVFVVGDKKIHGEIINGASFFSAISPFQTIEIIERSYTNTTSQVFDEINKTSRKEQIIVWQK